LVLSSLMNPLSTRLKLYRLAIGVCEFDAAGSWGAAFSPSLAVCAHENPEGLARMTASASVETRMSTSCEQRWDARSLAPTRDRLNPRESFRSAQPELSSPKIPFFSFISIAYAAGAVP
jgi:hypothetical protein